jgi:hypothetical protein
LEKKREGTKSPLKIEPRWNPAVLWVCFIFLLAGHLFLSYFSISLTARLYISLFLVALPAFFLLMAALGDVEKKQVPLYRLETFSFSAPILLVLTGLAAAAFHLYHLTTLNVWPNVDEGVHAFFSLQLFEHWQWRMFSYSSQMPSLYFWIEAFFFKLWGPSLFSLWLVPAFLSLVPFAFTYTEAKRYFSKSTAFVMAFLTGLGFWGLFLGRFSHPAVLVFPWACLALAGLGRVLSPANPKGISAALALGFITGSGFYTYFSWPPVALFVGLVMVWKARRAMEFRRPFWFFVLANLVCLVPLIWAMAGQGYGSYLEGHLPFSKPGGLGILLLAPFRYLRAVLYGDPDNCFYTSNWGGLLNPLWGALFWVGLAGLWRGRNRELAAFTSIGLVLLSLPGTLTWSVNSLRVTQCLPIMVFCSATGFQALAETLPLSPRKMIIALVLLGSVGLDGYHLFVPFHNTWSSPQGPWAIDVKSIEYSRVFPLLDDRRRREGPGFIYTCFQPNWTDQSLSVAVYPFNAAAHPGLPDSVVRWAAFVCNVHYQPFLKKRFPDGQWTWLSSDRNEVDGGLMLGVVPVTPDNRETWRKWNAAHAAFVAVVSELLQRVEGKSYARVRERLLESEPLMEGDPFLESCLWEQIFNSYNSDAAYGDHRVKEDFQGAKTSLEQALIRGYPAAHFYNELGSMEALEGNKREARKDFEKAVQSPFNATAAAENLKAVEQNGR